MGGDRETPERPPRALVRYVGVLYGILAIGLVLIALAAVAAAVFAFVD